MLPGVDLGGFLRRGRVGGGFDLIILPYSTYSDRQTWTNSVDPDQTPQNAASDQGLHCLPLTQQFSIHSRVVNTFTCSKMDLLKRSIWKSIQNLSNLSKFPSLNPPLSYFCCQETIINMPLDRIHYTLTLYVT